MLMLTDINSETTPKSFKRIGKEPQENRPLKIGFASVATSGSTSQDLTKDNRKIVKTWLKRAKEKNNKELKT